MEYTLSQAITKIKRFPEKAAEEARQEMRKQIHIKMQEPKQFGVRSTGGLERSVKKEQVSPSIWIVYPSKTVGGGMYETHDLGTLIRYGRPAVRVRYAKRLHWSVGGRDYYAQSVRPAEPQDFMTPTITNLLNREWRL